MCSNIKIVTMISNNGKKTNTCATKLYCNKTDIADTVKHLFYDNDLSVFFHQHKYWLKMADVFPKCFI